ncbi:class I SAM-dependent methyltransferase [Acinetobacter wuhouensis]|uniref:class I SAM-dependent methyltransferase n=1 Tax=Acinetobacter wuhouensis TaxID=1879050 RepID=UPI000839E55C|nr:class I SAM-dependent methyltransferase [Acinetobacter wuhouensis]AXQ23740.1 class I SAM-dependent methyltransferase [Acinetobacter wuhouensis]
MKDLFSSGSQLYQQARPSYPPEVIQEILNHVPARGFAWDCGAGSGQFTQLLAPYFDHIVATDISAQQLQHAPYFDNVSYQVQASEKTTFPALGFDLITVAQAIHWFDFDAFYREVCRTLKPDGVLAVIGYGLIQVENQAVNALVQRLYCEQLNGYWDAERRFIDEEYQTIPFPFEEIQVPAFKMQYQWTAAQLLKYLSTWSAVKHYCEKNPSLDHPLVALAEVLTEAHEDLILEFPIFLRVGKLKQVKKRRFMKK